MADVRTCEQCGIWFVPRREHARFCSADCRAAWNREHTGDLKAGASALVWAITAMRDTTERLPRMRAADRLPAFAVIGEAVWWVTMVDATLVRHHPDAYDAAMAGQSPAQRELTEGTLAGLRFVRNQIGHGADLAKSLFKNLMRRVAGFAVARCPAVLVPGPGPRVRGVGSGRGGRP